MPALFEFSYQGKAPNKIMIRLEQDKMRAHVILQVVISMYMGVQYAFTIVSSVYKQSSSCWSQFCYFDCNMFL